MSVIIWCLACLGGFLIGRASVDRDREQIISEVARAIIESEGDVERILRRIK